MTHQEKYEKALAEYEQFILKVEKDILTDFPAFQPFKPLHRYLIPILDEDTATYLVIKKSVPESVQLILECAFNMFMYKYDVNE